MNQQPDKLFHDKLSGYQRTAPARAWDKIDAGLSQNANTKSIGLWWKIAASVSVIGIAAYLLWPVASDSNVESSPLTEVKPQGQQPVITNNIQKPEVSDEPTFIAEEKIKSKLQKQSTLVTGKVGEVEIATTESPSVTPLNQTDAETQTILIAENTVEQNNTTVPLPADEQQTVIVNTSVEHKPVRLVFTVTDSEEYLDKKALAQATDEDKGASTFKKLLKKAKDLKNNQDPFGDLREKKNEILALNFRNEKRGQNK